MHNYHTIQAVQPASTMPTRSQSANLTAEKYTHALATIQSLYENYVAPKLPAPIDAILSSFLTTLVRAQPLVTQLVSLLTSLIGSLSNSGGGSAESTALISTAVLIITLYLSLRVFNYMRRMVMGWVIMLVKFVIILVGVQVVVYVNKYGWENAIRDASWWGGIVWGFVEEMLEGSDGGQKAPRGTRSRGSSARSARNSRNGYNGRGQVPGGGGGRTRW